MASSSAFADTKDCKGYAIALAETAAQFEAPIAAGETLSLDGQVSQTGPHQFSVPLVIMSKQASGAQAAPVNGYVYSVKLDQWCENPTVSLDSAD
jgi:acyl-CoA hydrolase